MSTQRVAELSTEPEVAEAATRARLRALDWATFPRGDVLTALPGILGGDEAARALGRLLRAHPGWSSAQRATVAEAVFGVALWRRRLAFHAGSEQPDALLDALLTQFVGPTPDPPPPHWPTRLSWPDALAVELEHALGAEVVPFAAACNLPGSITVRANRLRIDRDGLAARLRTEGVASRPTRHSPDGLHLEGRPNVLGLPSHQGGLFEVQDEGSQLIGLCVGPRPGERILDLCAGAGGKTLLLAAAVGPEGRVDAHDTDPAALERLRQRAARAGAWSIIRILHAPPEDTYDAVLVDAPCSALGALRRGPDTRWRLDVAGFARWPPLQRALLAAAAERVRPGGRLVHATCTVRPEENQQPVESFLATDRRYAAEVAPVADALRDGAALRCLPHRHGTDGFHASLLRRRE